jgi:triphosphatase
VGLRRLRTGLKLFAGLWPELAHPALPAFEEQAATWFRALGVVRDADVLHTGLSPQLQAALQAVCPDASLPVAATTPGGGAAAAAACVRQASAQQFLLEWMGWVELLGRNPMLAPTLLEPEALSLRRGLRRRLNRWHRQVQRDCAQFASLDIEARHRLRKRFKRLRYGVEFCASLFDAEALKRQLKPVVKAQEVLGELNDLELAITERRALSAEPQQDARAWFELGWLGARRTELLARSQVLMAAVAEAPKLL